jgi:phosphoglycerate dehydrogenase-like enzyme
MEQHKTVFVTHRGARHQEAVLAAAPAELDIQMLRSPSREELLAQVAQAEFLISERSGPIDAEIIRAGKHLRLIQRLGSQTHDIDLQAAREAGVPVCYWPVASCIMVSEHMVLQLLSLAKRLREVMDIALEAGDWGQESQRCDEDYFAYNWSGRQGLASLRDRTVGILGFGEIGTELSRRLRPFEPALVYNKRQRLPQQAEADLGIRFASEEALVAESDFLCALLPFFRETEQSIEADFFARMKPGACFVSCGAGGVIDEQALAEALRSGHLGGAALDTYTWEPIRPQNPLLPLARQPRANILLTPHTAAGADAANPKERRDDYGNLLHVLGGEGLRYQLV